MKHTDSTRVHTHGDLSERWIGKLPDAQLDKLSREVATHERSALRGIIRGAPVDKGRDAVGRHFHSEIEARTISYETQRLVWLAYDMMSEERHAFGRDARQLSMQGL